MDKIEQKVIRAAKKYYGVISQVADLNDNVEYIARLDDFGVYKNDIEAAKQAKKDGIKVIPYAEQPKSGDLKYFRFVDTPMNRKLLGI